MNKSVVAVLVICAALVLVFSLCRIWKRSVRRGDEEARPPVDLNKPVENPRLVAALDACADNATDEARAALCGELNRATYLAAVLTSQADVKTSESDRGHVVFEKGRTIHILTAAGPDDKQMVLLFTDWSQIRSWTSQNVDALVMPAQEAWSVALMGDVHNGVIINPAGNSFTLSRAQLEALREEAPNQSLQGTGENAGP